MTTVRGRVAAQLHQAAADARRVADECSPASVGGYDLEDVKAELRREFPEWSIIRSEPRGHWFATRGPKRGEAVQHGESCLEAATPEELRAQLREVGR